MKARINASQHGKRSMYVGGCRCEPCKEADRAYHRDYYARRKDEPNSPWRRKLKRLLIEDKLRAPIPTPPSVDRRGSESAQSAPGGKVQAEVISP